MVTTTPSSTPRAAWKAALQVPTPDAQPAAPASTVAGATSRPLAGEPPVVLVPTPAGWETGGTPYPGASHRAGATSASQPPLAHWQRVDAAWPTLANSPSGLDGDAQKLVRRLFTQAAGQRLKRRRQLEAARLWVWQPQPHLADYVRQRRFYAPGLYRFQPPDLYGIMQAEARLALEVIATPPGALGVEVWQALLELQCQRLGQLHAALRHWLGAARAQQALQGILEALI